jgi:hypothetical protein
MLASMMMDCLLIEEHVMIKMAEGVEGYRAGLDRNPRTQDWRPKTSHTYAMMKDGELWPMCGYGWNRSDGHAFSILRQVPGSQGNCKLCAKNVEAGKPPVMDGFDHKTRWL